MKRLRKFGYTPTDGLKFDYDGAAKEFLNRHDATQLLPRCRALFIDEAQDMGPSTLKLLLSLVEQSDPTDANSRAAHIFYDNAQNIYQRGTPKWSELGIDLRGRSTIMKESFRSTHPITEYAVNVLHGLAPLSDSADHQELLKLGLVERTEREGHEWLRVHFNQAHGPRPVIHQSRTIESELSALAEFLKRLIVDEQVSPSDICLIHNYGRVAERLEMELGPILQQMGVELSLQTQRAFQRRKNTLLVTTPHSFKGYDAEVVVIPSADQFVTNAGQILATNLYVAMTRARSLLAIFSVEHQHPAIQSLNETLARCARLACLSSDDP